MRSSTRHLLIGLTAAAATIAAAGTVVGVAAGYWAAATCALVAVATMSAHRWMPSTDGHIKRFIVLCSTLASLSAVVGALVFNHRGAGASLVAVATVVAGMVGLPLGGCAWTFRWTAKRLLVRVVRACEWT